MMIGHKLLDMTLTGDRSKADITGQEAKPREWPQATGTNEVLAISLVALSS